MRVSAGLVTDRLFEHARIVRAFWIFGVDGFDFLENLFPVRIQVGVGL